MGIGARSMTDADVAVAVPAWAPPPDDVVTSDQQRQRSWLLSLVTIPVIVVTALAPAALGKSGLLGLVAIGAAVALILIAQSPLRVGLAVVALVPVTSGLARGLVVPGFRLSEVLIVVGALCLTALPTELRRRWSGLDRLVLVYAALGTLLPFADLFLVSGRPVDTVAIQTLLGPIQFALLYFVSSTCFRTEHALVLAQRALLLASVPVSVIGIAEAVAPPAFHDFLTRLSGTTAFNTQGYVSVARAASVFPVWLALAGYLLVILVLATALLLVGDRTVLPFWGLLIVIGLGLLALLVSLTVTITVVYAVTALYLGYRHRRLGLVVIMLGIVAATAQLAFGTLIEQRAQAQTVAPAVHRTGPSWLPQTLSYRVQIWQDQYAPSLSRYAASGFGPGFPPGVDWSHTESGYITLLLRGGVPYLAGTGLLLVGIVNRSRHELGGATTTARSALCEAAAVVVIVQVPINVTFPYFTASGLPQPAWILWGLLAAQEVRRRPRPTLARGDSIVVTEAQVAR
jgi:hypothetical protein